MKAGLCILLSGLCPWLFFAKRFSSCRIVLSTLCPFIGSVSSSADEVHGKRRQRDLLVSPDLHGPT